MFRRKASIFTVFFLVWTFSARADLPESIRRFLVDIQSRFEHSRPEIALSQLYTDIYSVFRYLKASESARLWFPLPSLSAAIPPVDRVSYVLPIMNRLRLDRQISVEGLALLRELQISVDLDFPPGIKIDDEVLEQLQAIASDKMHLREILSELLKILHRAEIKTADRLSELQSLPTAALQLLKLDLIDFEEFLLPPYSMNQYVTLLHTVYNMLFEITDYSQGYDFFETSRRDLLTEALFTEAQRALFLRWQVSSANPGEKVELLLVLQAKVRGLIWGLLGRHSSATLRQTLYSFAKRTFFHITYLPSTEIFIRPERVGNITVALTDWKNRNCRNAIENLGK